jgi:hypothetical protein
VDAIFKNGRSIQINDGHGGLNAGRSIEKYLGAFEGEDFAGFKDFKMKAQLK